MIRIIMGTMGTRAIAAVLAFISWMLVANYLGAGPTGTISLIIFSVTLIQLLTNFTAGSGLVYYTPREGVSRLIVPAYVLTPILALAGVGILVVAGTVSESARIIPEGYTFEVTVLALVISFSTANNMFLLGLGRVKAYNLVTLLQASILVLSLILCFFVFRFYSLISFYLALLLSHFLSLLVSVWYLRPEIRRASLSGCRGIILQLFRFSSFVQAANVFQTLNYRLGLKFVDHFLGRAPVGILTIGLQLSEAVWILSRSISTVQYSRLSNEMKFDYSVRLTLTLVKISFVITLLPMILLAALPESFYMVFLPASFTGVRSVILSLAPGVVVLSVSIVLSSFFSAINKPYHNTVSSAAGLAITILAGLWLIPRFGLAGAGWMASASYLVITLYQFLVFCRISALRPGDFLPKKSDWQL